MARETPECILDALARYGYPLEQLEQRVSAYTSPILDLIKRSRELMENRSKPWEYKTLAQAGAEDFAVSNPNWVHQYSAGGTTLSPHPLSGAAENYSREVTRYIAYLDEGMPLYIRQEGGEFREANDGDEVWLFVRLLLKHGGWSDLSFAEPPQWATSLWLSRADLEANGMIYGDPDYKDNALWQRTRTLRINVARAFRAGFLSDRQSQFFNKSGLASEPQATVPEDPSALPAKLEAALAAYQAVQSSEELRRGRSAKAALIFWLERNRPGLSNQAREEIAKVANWSPEGGAPRTPD